MKMVLKMLEDNQTINPQSNFEERGKFWAKVQMPDGSLGILPSELLVDNNDNLVLACPRRVGGSSFLRLFKPKPLPSDSKLTLAYQNNEDLSTFEIWSGSIGKFLRTDKITNLDEYEFTELKQEIVGSAREFERFVVSIPLKLESLGQKKGLNKILCFSGCELSENGLGLWLSMSNKSKIQINETYKITFEPAEVESFSFEIQCIRPHFEDSFSKGIHAGFKLLNYAELKNSLPFIRLKQLIEARGKLPDINLDNSEHYLAKFWQGEFLKFSK